MTINVFGRNIEIPDALVLFFEENFDKLTENKIGYLATAMNVDSADSDAVVQEKMIKGIIMEMELQVDVSPILAILKKEGYIIL